ncbi:MAG: 50S ribosomal protein L35 [Planctomycetota bacterium]
MSNKTHKGMKKRLKKTKHGKVKHKRTGNRHLMQSKDSKRSRQLRKPRDLDPSDLKNLRRQYGDL